MPGYCPACGQAVKEEAAFCSACGRPLTPQPQTPGRGAAPPQARAAWYYSRWFVLLMLTPFALGPFALPLLWKSPAFSKPAKWWLTLGTALWTALFVVYVMQHVVPAVTHELRQLESVLSGV